MCCVAQTVAVTLRAGRLVSGGSAWADNVAIQLFLDGAVKELSLHLPVQFDFVDSLCEYRFGSTQEGKRLNDLHGAFCDKTGINPWEQIETAIKNKGAKVAVNLGGFKARNTDVANEANTLLAFTFADKVPNDGGTRDTWDKFLARRVKYEAKNELHELQVFHFSLTTHRLCQS